MLHLLLGALAGAAIASAAYLWRRQRRKARETTDAATRALLRRTLEHIDQGFAVFDGKGRLQVWNDRYFTQTGIPSELARRGLPVREVIRYLVENGAYGAGYATEADMQRLQAEVMACDPPQFDAQGPQGQMLRVQRNRLPGGGIAVTVTDISDLKQRERELERTSADLQLVFASTDEGIAVLDDGLMVTAVNDRMAELMGESQVAFRKGMHITEYYRARRAAGEFIGPDGEAEVNRRMQLWESGEAFVIQATGRNDRILEFHVAVTDDAGRVVTCRDVTAQRHYEQALREAKEQAELANRAKSEFLANTSHELRTPLNAIIGFAEVLMGEMYGAIGDRKYLEYARDIRDSGEHLLSLINDLLNLAKIESGHYELHEEPLDLSRLIDACLRLVRERAAAAQIELQKEMEDDQATVFADQRALKQILINLLSNAVKFTPPGGRVTVSSSQTEDGGLRLSVTDTGIGMDRDEIDTALAPFGQVDSTLSRRFEGTGLGLPLAQRMVENHDGKLTIDSSKGVGTTVTVHLPPRRLFGHPGRALVR